MKDDNLNTFSWSWYKKSSGILVMTNGTHMVGTVIIVLNVTLNSSEYKK